MKAHPCEASSKEHEHHRATYSFTHWPKVERAVLKVLADKADVPLSKVCKDLPAWIESAVHNAAWHLSLRGLLELTKMQTKRKHAKVPALRITALGRRHLENESVVRSDVAEPHVAACDR